MLNSYIKDVDGTPGLFIDDQLTTAMAYTTYFEERSLACDFIKRGYRIFFVNLSFTKLPINSFTSFTPFRVGVFEDPDNPDYSEFESAVLNILKACPDAIIFPRIHISMPTWWIDSHPCDVIPTPRGGYREILFSESFRNDAKKMLRDTVMHIKSSAYADRIGGWQICGGGTQEWFHHDLNGSIAASVEEPFRAWVKENYNDSSAYLPDIDDFTYRKESVQTSENARRYSEFCNLEVAKTVELLAKAIKEETDHSQVVGAFYGYSLESCMTVLLGTHAIRALLDSPYLNFFSSPNAYTDNRAFGIDWGDMLPIASLKHHGKLCFIECDIRTYLTVAVQEARPGEYPNDIYKTEDEKSVWAGPPTPELSRKALRKCFAHQITNASAIWWFDMWGGWYDDEMLLRDLEIMKKIYDSKKEKPTHTSREIVLFTDERAYSNLYSNSPQLEGIYVTRKAIGNIGAPYDIFATEDAEDALKSCKAAIFLHPVLSESGINAVELCKKMNIPYLCPSVLTPGLTEDQMISFLKDNGIHLYSENKDVVYLGNGYIALHSADGGKKTLKLPRMMNVTPIFGADAVSSTEDSISFNLEENGTALFSIE